MNWLPTYSGFERAKLRLRILASILLAALALELSAAPVANQKIKLPIDLTKVVRQSQPEIEAERNIVWAIADGDQLFLDAFRPRVEGSYPVVVNIHGGGWSYGSK